MTAITYPCGCYGLPQKDERGNVYICPHTKCFTHANATSMRRTKQDVIGVYKCSCYIATPADYPSVPVNMRCDVHSFVVNTSPPPFMDAANAAQLPCGCTGRDVGVIRGPERLYFVPFSHKCQTHAVQDGAAVMLRCGCAISDVESEISCVEHGVPVLLEKYGRDIHMFHPFVDITDVSRVSCGCKARLVGLGSPDPYQLYFVPPTVACQIHASKVGPVSFLMHPCGCALYGLESCAPCAEHAHVLAHAPTDPFLKPNELQRMLGKK